MTVDFSLMMSVSELIRGDKCGDCLVGKAAALEMFIAYVRILTPKEKRVSILTALSVLFVAEDARPRRVRSTGERLRFHYHLPFVGRVCKSAFLRCYGISAPTLARYRHIIRSGRMLAPYEDEL